MEGRDWASLPDNVLSSILSNLFAKDRYSFSLACKSWNQASKYSPFRHSPCLFYYHKISRDWNLFQYNSSLSIFLPEHISRAEIRCVKYGWMLMSCNCFSMFFFDPFNNQTIHLPQADYYYSTLCFFHPPTAHNCFIIGIYNAKCTKDVRVGVLKRGINSKWRKRIYHSKTDLKLSRCTPVLHRGLLHCLDVQGKIATFDIDKRDSPNSLTVITKCLSPPRLCKKIQRHFLVRLNDEPKSLLAVLVAQETMKVHVFRMVSEPRVRWEPVEDLGDKVLFVSNTASFAATAPWRSMANRIYFAHMHGDNDFVYYCLKAQNYHSCSSTDYSSYGLRYLNFATWIVPTPTPEFPSNLTWCSSNVDVSEKNNLVI